MTGPLTTTVDTPDERTIRLSRSFNAPAALVAGAFTTPDLMQRWMGVFGDWTWAECSADLRPGGAYRYVWRQPDGTELALSGEYQEVDPPHRYVFTQVYEGMEEFPGEMLVTLRFTEEAGRTTAETTVEYASQAERDLDLQYMPGGMDAGYQQLDRVLASLDAQ